MNGNLVNQPVFASYIFMMWWYLYIFLFDQANVMLEYDIDEAESLLEKNLATASKNLDSLEDDLDFLRDQFTTTEVSILE